MHDEETKVKVKPPKPIPSKPTTMPMGLKDNNTIVYNYSYAKGVSKVSRNPIGPKTNNKKKKVTTK